MDRIYGYYILEKNSISMIGQWKRGFWHICGVEDFFTDEYFDVIGKRIF